MQAAETSDPSSTSTRYTRWMWPLVAVHCPLRTPWWWSVYRGEDHSELRSRESDHPSIRISNLLQRLTIVYVQSIKKRPTSWTISHHSHEFLSLVHRLTRDYNAADITVYRVCNDILIGQLLDHVKYCGILTRGNLGDICKLIIWSQQFQWRLKYTRDG